MSLKWRRNRLQTDIIDLRRVDRDENERGNQKRRDLRKTWKNQENFNIVAADKWHNVDYFALEYADRASSNAPTAPAMLLKRDGTMYVSVRSVILAICT